MATSLSEIRAKLAAQDTRKDGKKAGNSDTSVFSHWNMEEGATSRVRFLPDANAANTFFWAERAMIKLTFSGIKGQPESKPVEVQVPCMEMYGKDTPCPILSEVRTWFKDPNLEELGRKYWKKRSYLFQGFVRDSAVKDDKTPENPIRRFVISPQIFNLVKSALMDPDLENLPTDYDGGLDFSIIKSSKGGYADYSTSKWSRKETALTSDERAAIDQFGLYDLSTFLPKKPTDAELRIIKEMFEASVEGEAYDPVRWGQYYKPYGLQIEGSQTEKPQAAAPVQAAPKAKAAPAPVVEDYEEEVAATPVVAPAAAKPSSQRAEDILALIRNRQK
ncbi:hypothetical protein UFOVP116_46 [uncultured Caudovirales phage]|uniref:Single-stranded DNA-binding protein n=1 Tax=uncultured Caudovirales phage TaxID=2100421 RepID=A0A6J5L5H9_9CAUD|nr:hypothetical protein UFOVP116_46 [uncultured Caudovirales phage]